VDTSAKAGRIVVGVDGSSHARRALRWAAAEATRRGAQLDVVMAWTLLGDEAHDKVDPKASDDKARDKLRQILHEELGDQGDAAADGVQVTVVNDLAAKALLRAGEGADLLVVGSRGLGGFRELLLGSVSSQVVRHAPCAVVVIPGEERAAVPPPDAPSAPAATPSSDPQSTPDA
jgi:nucleotide-binding universal stress UspA family protein